MSSDLGSLWGTTALPMWSEYRNVGTGGNTLIFFFLNQEIQVCGTQATLAHPVPRAGSINQVLHFPAKPRCSLRIYPSTFRNAAASMHAAMPAEIKPHPWEGSQKPEAGSPLTWFPRRSTWAWVQGYVTSLSGPQLLLHRWEWGSRLPKAHLLKMSPGSHLPSLNQTTRALLSKHWLTFSKELELPHSPQLRKFRVNVRLSSSGLCF